MIQLDLMSKWVVPGFLFSEGRVIAGSEICVWCERSANVGELVFVVQEKDRCHKFAMHPACLPPEVKVARKLALGHAQVEQYQAPQRE